MVEMEGGWEGKGVPHLHDPTRWDEEEQMRERNTNSPTTT